MRAATKPFLLILAILLIAFSSTITTTESAREVPTERQTVDGFYHLQDLSGSYEFPSFGANDQMLADSQVTESGKGGVGEGYGGGPGVGGYGGGPGAGGGYGGDGGYGKGPGIGGGYGGGPGHGGGYGGDGGYGKGPGIGGGYGGGPGHGGGYGGDGGYGKGPGIGGGYGGGPGHGGGYGGDGGYGKGPGIGGGYGGGPGYGGVGGYDIWTPYPFYGGYGPGIFGFPRLPFFRPWGWRGLPWWGYGGGGGWKKTRSLSKDEPGKIPKADGNKKTGGTP